jgi:hypothetical protein
MVSFRQGAGKESQEQEDGDSFWQVFVGVGVERGNWHVVPTDME